VLSPETVEKIEWAAEEELEEDDDVMDAVGSRWAQFFRRPR